MDHRPDTDGGIAGFRGCAQDPGRVPARAALVLGQGPSRRAERRRRGPERGHEDGADDPGAEHGRRGVLRHSGAPDGEASAPLLRRLCAAPLPAAGLCARLGIQLPGLDY
eukprot:7143170-Heterocapsa_arctica.AAC.1